MDDKHSSDQPQFRNLPAVDMFAVLKHLRQEEEKAKAEDNGLWIVPKILVQFPISMLGGYVLGRLWLWFIVPSTGFRPISLWEGCGLLLISEFFQMATTVKLDNIMPSKLTGKSLIQSTAMSVFIYMIFWGFGWIYHQF